MTRAPLTLLTLALTLAAPALARADDGTLLSGYGGPGGGQQVVLGSKLLPPKHGSGSLKAPATGRPAAVASSATAGAAGPATTAARSSVTTSRGGARAAARAGSSRRATSSSRGSGPRASATASHGSSHKAAGSGGAATTSSGASTSTAATPVRYASEPAASTFPVTAAQGLLAVLALGLALLVAFLVRSTVRDAGPRRPARPLL